MRALFALAVLLMTAAASSQDRVPVVLGTATPGGGFPVYGAAFAEMVNAQEPALEVRPQNTKGSTENVPLLEAGKLDLGLVAGEVASAALAKPGTTLRIVAAMYASPGVFMVRNNSPVRSISDLKGKPVVFGARLEQAKESTAANTVAAAPRTELIHPGVQRYLREIGLLR